MVNVCEECNLHEGHEVHNGKSFPLLAAHSFKLLKLVTEPNEKQIMELATKLGIRTWDQGNDGFGGEWEISDKKRTAIKAFWQSACASEGQGWVSAKDSMPTEADAQIYPTYTLAGLNDLAMVQWYSPKSGLRNSSWKSKLDATYWRRLPAPPSVPAGPQEEKNND